ncbi:MAG TPA: MogA/MoaB family molybdenum cofactor biosynthesis protein [Gemmatimonadales bacterium]|jgi:molybdenum cofactor biosynthesis protein B|nr:MogA/MoaB family molybdenum cofactor biosynthesis protein [Gemmatimonadales bacterium]
MRGVDAHRADAPDSVRCAVLTVSDTRTPDSDSSGALIRDTLNFSAHTIVDYRIVPDEPDEIREILTNWIRRDDVQAILTNGGTGIAARDTTYDAISGMLEKRIDGFGELFRMLSWQEVGAAAMLSRAVAGVAGKTLVVAMPGSTNAVRLALTKLIVPELGHLVYEIAK